MDRIEIISLCITVVALALTVYGIIRAKKKVKLNFEIINSYLLYKDDIKRLDLEVFLAGNKVESHLIILKGKIVNKGDLDLINSYIYSPIELSFLPNYHILKVLLAENSIGKIKLEDNNKVTFDLDLLKVNESINFEFLIQSEDIEKLNDLDASEKLISNLKINSRIKDAPPIAKPITPRRKLYLSYTQFPLYLIFIVLGIICSFIPFSNKSTIDQEYILDSIYNIRADKVVDYSIKIDSVFMEYRKEFIDRVIANIDNDTNIVQTNFREVLVNLFMDYNLDLIEETQLISDMAWGNYITITFKKIYDYTLIIILITVSILSIVSFIIIKRLLKKVKG